MIGSTATDSRPIGVFDSGVGGLTVLRALISRFPGESFIYLGDTARLPYGSKSSSTIRRYAEQVLNLLVARKVKAVVVACNSASTTLPETEWQGLPLYTVIRPGAETALRASSAKKIGVMGTRATIQSEAYTRQLIELDSSVHVYTSACPLLVPLAEEGWVDDPITNLVAFRYLNEFSRVGVDTVIMGCTHYPILKPALTRVMGPRVTFVDSGEALADALATDFAMLRLAPATGAKGDLEVLCTDMTDQFVQMTETILGDFLPQRIIVQRLDL